MKLIELFNPGYGVYDGPAPKFANRDGHLGAFGVQGEKSFDTNKDHVLIQQSIQPKQLEKKDHYLGPDKEAYEKNMKAYQKKAKAQMKESTGDVTFHAIQQSQEPSKKKSKEEIEQRISEIESVLERWAAYNGTTRCNNPSGFIGKSRCLGRKKKNITARKYNR